MTDVKVLNIDNNIFFEDLQKLIGAEGQSLNYLAKIYTNDQKLELDFNRI